MPLYSRIKCLWVIPWVLLIWATSAWSQAETFYVCQGGDGSLPEIATCATAWDAVDFSTAANWSTTPVSNDGKIGPGDTVIILNDGGVITGTDALGVLRQRQGGTLTYPIIVQGESGEVWTISGQSARPCIFSPGSWITWRDFRCTLGTDGVITYGNTNVTIEDCEVDNVIDDAIAVQGNTGKVRRCYVHDNGDVGIYLTGDADFHASNWVIEHNRVVNNGMGIQVNSEHAGNQAGNVIRHNWVDTANIEFSACFNELAGNGTVYNGNVCDCTGTVADRAGMWIGTDGVGLKAVNILAYNNTFYCDSDYVLNVGGSSTGNVFKNNIAVQLSNNAIYDVETGSTVNFDYNLLFPAQLTGFVTYGATTYNDCASWRAKAGDSDDNGVCNSNPNFTSAGVDFTLSGSSPAINAGVNLGATYDDALSAFSNLRHKFGRLSEVRVIDQDDQGGGWEIGAYVFADKVNTCNGVFGPEKGPAVTTGLNSIFLSQSLGLGNGSCGTYNPDTDSCTGGSKTAYSDPSTANTALHLLPVNSVLFWRAGDYSEAAKLVLDSRQFIVFNKEAVSFEGCIQMPGIGGVILGPRLSNPNDVGNCGQDNPAVNITGTGIGNQLHFVQVGSGVGGGTAGRRSVFVDSNNTGTWIHGSYVKAIHATERWGTLFKTMKGVVISETKYDAIGMTDTDDGIGIPGGQYASSGDTSTFYWNCFAGQPTDTMVDIKGSTGPQVINLLENTFIGYKKDGTSYPCLLVRDSDDDTGGPLAGRPTTNVLGNGFFGCTPAGSERAITIHNFFPTGWYRGAVEGNLIVAGGNKDAIQVPTQLQGGPRFARNTVVGADVQVVGSLAFLSWDSNLLDDVSFYGAGSLAGTPCDKNNYTGVTGTGGMTCNGNTAHAPQFAGLLNWNPRNPSLLTDRGVNNTIRGAFQPPVPTSGLTLSANVIRLSAAVANPPLRVDEGCNGVHAVASVTGVLTETLCTVSGDSSVDITVSQTMVSSDVITVSLDAAAITDSRQVAGPAGPGYYSEVMATTGIVVVNTIGSAGTNLLTLANKIADSGGFLAAAPVDNLYDGSTATRAIKVAAASWFVEHDLGASQILGDARIWGSSQPCGCVTWTFEWKVLSGDAYTPAFSAAPCNGAQWWQETVGQTARFVKVTVNGSITGLTEGSCSADGGTRADELEVSPGVPEDQGVLTQIGHWFRRPYAGELFTPVTLFNGGVENNDITLSPGSLFQLRTGVKCVGAVACDQTAFYLASQLCSPNCPNVWEPLGTAGSLNGVVLVSDGLNSHGQVTSIQLNDGGEFVGGRYHTSNSTTEVFTLGSGQKIESVYVISMSPTLVRGQDTLKFKMLKADGTDIGGNAAVVTVGRAKLQR